MQTCSGNADAEFGTWGPCVGEEKGCGYDAGQPDCPCVAGTTIQCDEDCTVSIFCSLTATKMCQPDGTWGPCREANGATNNVAALLGDAGIAGLSADGGITGLFGPDSGIVNLPGVASGLGPLLGDASVLSTGPCRTMFHGCEGIAQRELFTGDCSKQFTCQHAPQ